jgi:hypothetical protein
LLASLDRADREQLVALLTRVVRDHAGADR